MASFVYPQEREDDQHLICEFRARDVNVVSEFGGAAEVLISFLYSLNYDTPYASTQ